MGTYDPAKAKALFDAHIKPVRQSFGEFAYYPAFGDAVNHYVITPEMLRVLRYALWSTYERWDTPDGYERRLRKALWEHIDRLDPIAGPDLEWHKAIKPDPKPAWRIAADDAYDEGLEFSAVLDAIQKTLEEK